MIAEKNGASSLGGRLPGILLSLALAIVSWYVAMLPGLKVMGALTIALLIGILWRLALGLPEQARSGTRFSARSILRLGIILMGMRLDFDVVAQAGPKVLVLDATIITLGLVAIFWFAQRFGVRPKLAMLLAVGSSICGASAVAAAAPVTQAEEEDVTLACALCGVLGTLGVLFYVLVGPYLGLSTMQLAILSGASLHEVAQVMAAAFTWGAQTGEMGTLVKLTRVVLLAPALVILGLTMGGRKRLRFTWQDPPVPWFIVGFLAMGAMGSLGLVPTITKAWVSNASVFLMVMAMAAMGLNTHLDMIRKAGMKVVYAGLLGFAMLATASGLLIHWLRMG